MDSLWEADAETLLHPNPVQELALAVDCVYVCGNATILFYPLVMVTFASAHRIGVYMADYREGEIIIVTQAPVLYLSFGVFRRRSELQELLKLLRLCRFFDASNLHDKIYAILGLLPDADTSALRPEYTTPIEDVFWHAPEYAFDQAQRPELLHCAGIGRKRYMSRLPSWVPDFSAYTSITPPSLAKHFGFIQYSATPTPAEFHFDSQNRWLTISGRTLFPVTEIMPLEPQIRHYANEQTMRGETYAQFGLGSTACGELIADAGTREGYIGRAKGEWKDAVFEWWSVLYSVSLEFLKNDRGMSEEAATDLLNSEQPLLQKFVKRVDMQQKLIDDFGSNRAAHRERRVFATANGITGLGPSLM